MYWILKGHTPVRAADVLEWGRWFETAERHVADDTITRLDADPVRVSTVFLGLEHGGALFESMVFDGPLDGEQHRYMTWDEAERGHQHLLAESVTEGELAAWQTTQLLNKIKT